MLIDAHQHFWRLSERAGYWPPAELAAIYRDFAPADLEPLLRDAVVLDLPFSPLCRDDCAGLCPDCGVGKMDFEMIEIN